MVHPPLTDLYCTLMVLKQERSNEVARYYLDRDEVFLEDLPVLGQQGGSFAAPREKKEPIGAVGRPATDDYHYDGFRMTIIVY